MPTIEEMNAILDMAKENGVERINSVDNYMRRGYKHQSHESTLVKQLGTMVLVAGPYDVTSEMIKLFKRLNGLNYYHYKFVHSCSCHGNSTKSNNLYMLMFDSFMSQSISDAFRDYGYNSFVKYMREVSDRQMFREPFMDIPTKSDKMTAKCCEKCLLEKSWDNITDGRSLMGI